MDRHRFSPGGYRPLPGKTPAQEWQELVEDWIVLVFGEGRLNDELYDLEYDLEYEFEVEFEVPFRLFIAVAGDERLYYVEEFFSALKDVGVFDEPFLLPRD